MQWITICGSVSSKPTLIWSMLEVSELNLAYVLLSLSFLCICLLKNKHVWFLPGHCQSCDSTQSLSRTFVIYFSLSLSLSLSLYLYSYLDTANLAIAGKVPVKHICHVFFVVFVFVFVFVFLLGHCQSCGSKQSPSRAYLSYLCRCLCLCLCILKNKHIRFLLVHCQSCDSKRSPSRAHLSCFCLLSLSLSFYLYLYFYLDTANHAIASEVPV